MGKGSVRNSDGFDATNTNCIKNLISAFVYSKST